MFNPNNTTKTITKGVITFPNQNNNNIVVSPPSAAAVKSTNQKHAQDYVANIEQKYMSQPFHPNAGYTKMDVYNHIKSGKMPSGLTDAQTQEFLSITTAVANQDYINSANALFKRYDIGLEASQK